MGTTWLVHKHLCTNFSRSTASPADLSRFRSSVQLQQQARFRNTRANPQQAWHLTRANTHIVSKYFYFIIFSLFCCVTVNTLQPHTSINVEQQYNRHNQYNTSKDDPSGSTSTVFLLMMTMPHTLLIYNQTLISQMDWSHQPRWAVATYICAHLTWTSSSSLRTTVAPLQKAHQSIIRITGHKWLGQCNNMAPVA